MSALLDSDLADSAAHDGPDAPEEAVPVPPDDLLPPPTADARELHRHFLRQAALAAWNGYRLMVLIRRMLACEGYVEFGCPTMAHYLELVCGITGSAARERIRVAAALAALPAIERALARGEISYSKVRAVTRVAAATTAAEWLAEARVRTAEELEVLVARSLPGRPLTHRLSAKALNGSTGRMIVDLPLEEMEVVMRALARIRREAGGTLGASEALVYLAADSLAGEPRGIDGAERYMVVVHAGKDGTAWAETAEGPAPVRPEVVERLLCDCTLRLAREDDDGSFVLSRRQRTVPRLTRRAVELRDGRQCRVTGCRRLLWLDLHHRRWRSRGGRHQRGNLCLLCPFHHKLAHLGLLEEIRDEKREVRYRVKAGWVMGEPGDLEDDEVWEWARALARYVGAEDVGGDGGHEGPAAADRVEDAGGSSVAGERRVTYRPDLFPRKRAGRSRVFPRKPMSSGHGGHGGHGDRDRDRGLAWLALSRSRASP